ncbi:MAG: MFS transporter [Alphaproteobacteria bacterium]|nr:MFS transporter [Alphaproteobacteria bacterium]
MSAEEREIRPHSPAGAPRADGAAGGLGAFRFYLAIQSSWFLAIGSHMVLFPYLVADRLDMSPQLVGLAQVSLMGPTLFLLLIGGVTADRVNTRRLLMWLHLLAMIPASGLALVIALGALSYPAIIVFGLCMGTLSAFTMPARDSMLTPLVTLSNSPLTIQRAVMLANMTQFASQLSGMIVASAATFVGVAPILIFQALAVGSGALWVLRTPPVPKIADAPRDGRPRSTLGDITDTLRLLLRSPSMTTVTATVFVSGILSIGSFLVAMPILVRDEYSGGTWRFATFSVCFWTGTLIAAITLSRIGRIGRPGRAMMLAMVSAASFSLILTQTMPFPVFCGLCLLWGMSAGVSMTMSRSLIQEAAPAAHRARLLSIYQLGFMGGAPVGALAMGPVVDAIGPHLAFLVPSLGMASVFLVLASRTDFWRLRLEDVTAERDRLWQAPA